MKDAFVVSSTRVFDLPMEGAVALLLVVDVVALVLAAVGPLEHALALHFVVPPHAAVLATVRPIVHTYSKQESAPLLNRPYLRIKRCGTFFLPACYASFFDNSNRIENDAKTKSVRMKRN